MHRSKSQRRSSSLDPVRLENAELNGEKAQESRVGSIRKWKKKREDKKSVTFEDNVGASEADVGSVAGTVRRRVSSGSHFPSEAVPQISVEQSPSRNTETLPGFDDLQNELPHVSQKGPEDAKADSTSKGQPDLSHWTRLRQQLEEEAKVKEHHQKTKKKEGQSPHKIPHQRRTVSRDDYLTSRGANPRTGVISPIVTSGSNTSHDSRIQERSKHFAAHQKWRLRGNQWISVDVSDKTPSGEHVKLRPSREDQRDRPSVKDQSPLGMSTQQVRDYHRAIARVYRNGEKMLDPNTLPTPRTLTPEGRSTPPRKLEKIRRPSLRVRKSRNMPFDEGQNGQPADSRNGISNLRPRSDVANEDQQSTRHNETHVPNFKPDISAKKDMRNVDSRAHHGQDQDPFLEKVSGGSNRLANYLSNQTAINSLFRSPHSTNGHQTPDGADGPQMAVKRGFFTLPRTNILRNPGTTRNSHNSGEHQKEQTMKYTTSQIPERSSITTTTMTTMCTPTNTNTVPLHPSQQDLAQGVVSRENIVDHRLGGDGTHMDLENTDLIRKGVHIENQKRRAGIEESQPRRNIGRETPMKPGSHKFGDGINGSIHTSEIRNGACGMAYSLSDSRSRLPRRPRSRSLGALHRRPPAILQDDCQTNESNAEVATSSVNWKKPSDHGFATLRAVNRNLSNRDCRVSPALFRGSWSRDGTHGNTPNLPPCRHENSFARTITDIVSIADDYIRNHRSLGPLRRSLGNSFTLSVDRFGAAFRSCDNWDNSIQSANPRGIVVCNNKDIWTLIITAGRCWLFLAAIVFLAMLTIKGIGYVLIMMVLFLRVFKSLVFLIFDWR